MGAYTRTYSLTDGTTAYGSQVVFELDALGSSVNNIVNAQIASGAAIADSKLAQITTGSKVSGAAITLLTSVPSGAGALPHANLPDGHLMQIVNDTESAVATTNGTTETIPYDDSIPTTSEGKELLSVAITPTATTNLLHIVVVVHGAINASEHGGVALFDDDTGANAIAVAYHNADDGSSAMIHPYVIDYYMTAPTTSALTFSVRFGPATASNVMTVNGAGGARKGGGVLRSSITVTEIKGS